MNRPFACAMARLREAFIPRFFSLVSTRTRGSRTPARAEAVSSVEPSSTTRHSQSRRVFASARQLSQPFTARRKKPTKRRETKATPRCQYIQALMALTSIHRVQFSIFM